MPQTLIDFSDAPRLDRQLDRVRTLMSDHEWRTLDAIHDALQTRFSLFASTPSISARLRDLRKEGHIVERQLVSPGLFTYRVLREGTKHASCCTQDR